MWIVWKNKLGHPVINYQLPLTSSVIKLQVINGVGVTHRHKHTHTLPFRADQKVKKTLEVLSPKQASHNSYQIISVKNTPKGTNTTKLMLRSSSLSPVREVRAAGYSCLCRHTCQKTVHSPNFLFLEVLGRGKLGEAKTIFYQVLNMLFHTEEVAVYG